MINMFNICDLKTNKYLQKEISNSVDACVTAVVLCVSFAQNLKVHKNENFLGFDFEFCTVSLLVKLKYEGFVRNNF
jgi:hypothetical protein